MILPLPFVISKYLIAGLLLGTGMQIEKCKNQLTIVKTTESKQQMIRA